ncbi:DNA breaking-rejoining enzyme [Suillus subluteus]|nr:DNA breaking-rejoining enzyme [Suillus subluteus]
MDPPLLSMSAKSIDAPDFTRLQSMLMGASKGVTEGTSAEYKRCDSLNIDGTTKPSTQDRGTYSHAQKMHALMTYAFGRLNGLGNMPWHESDAGGGLMVGNPSISVEVSSYMCSLCRWKVQAGEVANSARAITSDILLKLYHHNHLAHNWTIRKYQPGERGQSGLDLWGGGRVRRLLQAAYMVSFLCMLHFDEVLKIQVHNLRAHEDRMVLHLPFRKTHQNGEIKLFHLWSLPSCEAHICPVRALAAWLSYLFRKIASGDRIAEANSPMSSEQFLELFRNNLLDINIDPAPYGTHLFRRGGCQYLHVEKCWPLRRILKYLISSNDDPAEPQEHFFDPNRPPRVKCPQCGRCCACA